MGAAVSKPADDSQESEFAETPQGFARLWALEFETARDDKWKKWQKRGKKIDERFRDEREANNGEKRWNLFSSNVRTELSTLYGRIPQGSVTRRFADANDDVARVAGVVMERHLNTDIERDGDGYALAVQNALQDWRLPGLGNARVRYVMEDEEVPEQPAKLDAQGTEMAPAVEKHRRKTREDVEVDYVHWQDQLWSPARTWQELRWWAFRAEMSRQSLIKRFGATLGKAIPLNAKRSKKKSGDEPAKPSPWGRAEVWEIWDKERERVFWYVEGFDKTLGPRDAPEQGYAEDPLELRGFWPFPRPLIANATTSAFLPTPDFILAQDLYNEIDQVQTKLSELQEAMRVVGIYDQTHEALQSLLEAGGRNKMIPVANWGALSEKGGLRGSVDWLPLEQIANTMDKLRERLVELTAQLDQVEGTSDLMRGQGEVDETARAAGIKARFGSVRLQAKQDELARFASELLWLKAQLVARFFDEETIYERSNAAYLQEDPQLVRQAVALIKERVHEYRVQVKPENVSLQDFAALKQESLEVLDAIGKFLSNALPMVQQMPNALPVLLEMLQWTISRLRGAATMEGILDRAINQAKQALAQAAAAPQGQQQPDPKLVAAQVKMQAQQQKAQLDEQKAQADMQRDVARQQLEVQGEAQKQAIQTEQNIKEEKMRLELKAQAEAQKQANAAALGRVVPAGGGL